MSNEASPLSTFSPTELFNALLHAIAKTANTEDSHGLLYTAISQSLTDLGVPANLLGYEYLRYGISLAVENKDTLYGITKVMYPAIAEEYHTRTAGVERAIRHAISICWQRGNSEAMQQYFGKCRTKKPTNSEFIAILADKLRITAT